MKILLCTNIKDEHNYKEWIKYHLALGFTNICIWDDESQEPVAYEDSRVFVTKKHSKKREYILASLNYARTIEADWLLHLDGDEYLYLGGKSLSEFLELRLKWKTKAIVFPWLFFGSNGKQEEKKGFVLDEFTQCNRKTSVYIKTMAYVPCIEDVRNAHIYIFKKDPEYLTFYGNEIYPITRYVSMYPEKAKLPTSETACIAHYYTQSWETFKRRRIRMRDDIQEVWSFSFDLTSVKPTSDFEKWNNHMSFPFVKDYFQKISS